MSKEKRIGKEALHHLIGVPLTIAQSSIQRLQDLAASKAPDIRQQRKNAKMIGEFAVKAGASKAKDLLRKTPQATTATTDARVPVESLEVDDEPILNYGVLSAPQIISLLGSLDVEQISLIHVYEQRNRKRRTVLAATQAALDR